MTQSSVQWPECAEVTPSTPLVANHLCRFTVKAATPLILSLQNLKRLSNRKKIVWYSCYKRWNWLRKPNIFFVPSRKYTFFLLQGSTLTRDPMGIDSLSFSVSNGLWRICTSALASFVTPRDCCLLSCYHCVRRCMSSFIIFTGSSENVLEWREDTDCFPVNTEVAGWWGEERRVEICLYYDPSPPPFSLNPTPLTLSASLSHPLRDYRYHSNSGCGCYGNTHMLVFPCCQCVGCSRAHS